MDWETMKKQQPTVFQMLERSFEKNRLAHAYIFEGTRGAGKKETAILLAQRMFCSKHHRTVPCGSCKDCTRIRHGNHPDVLLVEPDGKSIKKGQVEQLQKEFGYKGMESSTKVYIVNDSDKMTASAANSLLKFLEEPEGETLAILLTENIHFLLETVISRSQVLTFAPPSYERKAKLLVSEGIGESVAPLLARLPDHLLERYNEDKEWIVQGRSLVIQLTEEALNRPHQMLLTLQDKWLAHFKDREELDAGLDLLLFWYRDLLTVRHEETGLAFPEQRDQLKAEAFQRTELEVTSQLQAVLEAKRQLQANVNPQLLMERLLLRLQEGL
ncbi:DNA polymerase III subunit delta' [Thalassobacillus sp. C254]|uniref:DNA polymerase III subunit delta' n=1 Tax=Thalassobacillus sp. C254 TaxID=1225341 RepID=UPI0006D057C2|nr:DNA polymerase III subunit delta' [Thalassobacillus sp. C254]